MSQCSPSRRHTSPIDTPAPASTTCPPTPHMNPLQAKGCQLQVPLLEGVPLQGVRLASARCLQEAHGAGVRAPGVCTMH